MYWWHEKYRPRKPKYFNRVHTGYEWNKYNQTHYDHDNPPPKVVQGYKFNIFFPDLIDKQEAPTYHLDNVRSLVRSAFPPPCCVILSFSHTFFSSLGTICTIFPSLPIGCLVVASSRHAAAVAARTS